MSLLTLIAVLGLQAPNEAELRAKATSLVRGLGSSAATEREKAAAELIKIGPDVLPHLPSSEDKALTAEQRKELLGVIKKLWRARLERDVEGSWVDMPAKTMPLIDALAEIERLTGNQIRDQREEFNEEPTNPSIQWDGKKRRFWEAMDVVCKAGGVRMEHFAGEGAVSIRAGTDSGTDGSESTFGSIRVLPLSINLSRQFTDSEAKATVSLQAVYEPKLKPLLVEVDLAEFVIKDDKDRDIPLSSMSEQTSFSFGIEEGAHHFDLALPLAAPARDANKIKLIQGSATLQLPASNERFVFDEWTKEEPQEKIGSSAKVRCGGGKDEGDGLWSFQVYVKQIGETPEGESFILAALEPEVYLIHADGTRLAPNAGKNIREEDGELVAEYLTANAPGKMSDYKIAVRTPAGVSKIPVKFTIKDLPLP